MGSRENYISVTGFLYYISLERYCILNSVYFRAHEPLQTISVRPYTIPVQGRSGLIPKKKVSTN